MKTIKEILEERKEKFPVLYAESLDGDSVEDKVDEFIVEKIKELLEGIDGFLICKATEGYETYTEAIMLLKQKIKKIMEE